MNVKKRLMNVIFLLFIGFLIYPTTAYTASYGDGTYNSSKYSDTDINSSTANSIQINQAPGFSCTSQAPGSAPYLYQINIQGTTSTLYFEPALQPYNNYFISYGEKNLDEGHGVNFQINNSSGAIVYNIFLLKPNTIYTFKVRAGNNCRAGKWSNTLAIKAGTDKSKIVTKYYPHKQAIISKSLQGLYNRVRQKIATATKQISKKQNTTKLNEKNKQTTSVKNSTHVPKSSPKKVCFLWIFC